MQLKLAIGEHFYDIDQIGIKFYSLRFKKWIHLNAQDFLLESLIVFAIGVIISIVFFTAQGKKTIIKAKIRGADFVGYKKMA